MTDERWQAITRAAPAHAEREWQVLPENGLGAVIAYAAGPGRARPHLVPLDERHVVVELTRDGRTSRASEPMTPDDLAAIETAITEYLADVGLPAPPCAWWEIDLPGALDVDELCERLDQLAAALPGDDTGVARARREAQTILEAVQALLGESR
ncbi:DUF5956 family protein [Cellulomonas fimi]|uniref:Uncharacterized protein n=1 Tax=Cellulomonas fimi TaxID=1708 RepID=A0A7Y0QHJ8_CELFI|nr:DUF5956 family protein [Cellulomonas fimi]NMR20253.1 hypothetical protein [Cellulomonas fimi]